MTPPPSAVQLSAKDVDRLKAILAAVPPSGRRDYSSLKALIEETYGPPGVVTAGAGARGETFIEVDNAGLPDECLLAYLPTSGEPDVRLGLRYTCTGG